MKIEKVDYDFGEMGEKEPSELFICVAPDTDGAWWSGVSPDDSDAALADMRGRVLDSGEYAINYPAAKMFKVTL